MQVKVLALVACAVRAASAQPAEPYPVTVVDRPLVLLPGMTTLDLSLDMPTYVNTSTDMMGNTTTTRTTLGDYRNVDGNVSHAFGPVEVRVGSVAARNYDAASVGAAIAASDFGAASISLGITENNVERDISQSASYVHRLYRMPHVLALYASAGVDAIEIRETPADAPPTSGHLLGLSGDLSADVQITPNLAVAEIVGVGVPVSKSNTSARTSMGEITTLIASVGHWDFYVQFAIRDVTSTHRLFAAVGFTHRWD